MAGRVPGAPPGDRASYRQAPAITARCGSKGQASREDRVSQGREEGRTERDLTLAPGGRGQDEGFFIRCRGAARCARSDRIVIASAAKQSGRFLSVVGA